MDTIFMNSENSRPSEYNVLILKLTNRSKKLIDLLIRSKKRSKRCCLIKY